MTVRSVFESYIYNIHTSEAVIRTNREWLVHNGIGK